MELTGGGGGGLIWTRGPQLDVALVVLEAVGGGRPAADTHQSVGLIYGACR